MPLVCLRYELNTTGKGRKCALFPLFGCDFSRVIPLGGICQQHRFTTPSVLSELFAKDRAIWDRLTPEIQETLENVDDYYSYLRSPGLSIAHYWGFLWANSVLPRFIPGYTPDMKLTHNFERMIRVELDSFGLNPDDEEE